MSHSRNNIPLGAVLQQAGLVSAEQVNSALQKQKQTKENLRIGEILAIEGGIDSKTADFFAERWSDVVAEHPKQPIGQYLKQAALLDEGQIREILVEQQSSSSKFGEIAIARGWLKQATLDFFLRYLKSGTDLLPKRSERQPKTIARSLPSDKPRKVLHSGEKKDREYSQKVHRGFLEIKRKLLKLEGAENYSEGTLDRVLFWTNGHSVLTKKLFNLVEKDSTPLSVQQEQEQIDRLVQTKIINNWSNNELKPHLQGIRNRLIDNRECNPHQLLLLYQRVLTETVSVDDSKDQRELRNIGLVVKQQNRLVVANRIYQSVFNLSWVAQELIGGAKFSQGSQLLVKNQNPPVSIARTTRADRSKGSWFKLKNLLLLLALIGLLTLFINNVLKRIAVRKAFRQGNELLKQKSFAAAIDSYNKLLKIDSNYFQAWTNRGYALAGLQKYEAMRESCSAATIIDPTAVYAWNCQGEALHNLNRDTEAIAAFDKAISLNQSDPIFLINKSESLRALGDNPASIKSIQQAIEILKQIEAIQGKQEIGGEFAVALTLLGNRYRQQSNFDLAIATYDQAQNYAPKYFPARVGKGITLNSAQRYQEARSEFETILQDPQLTQTQQAQTWFYLGKTLCKSAQNVDGVEAFAKAIELNPDYEIAKEAQQRCQN